MTIPMLLFMVFGFLAIATALAVVTARNPVTSAVFLVGNLFILACMYAMMGADFVAAIQVLVYAGAIMVLFIFVIMLLNLQPEVLRGWWLRPAEVVVLLITVVAFGLTGLALFSEHAALVRGAFSPDAITDAGGNTFVVGMQLFSRFLWPFELASVLILLAMVAAITIAKKSEEPVGGAPKPSPGGSTGAKPAGPAVSSAKPTPAAISPQVGGAHGTS